MDLDVNLPENEESEDISYTYDDSSDEENFLLLISNYHQAKDSPINGGSRTRRQGNYNSGHAEGHEKIMHDYFVNNPVYNDDWFCWRFRIRWRLFLRISGALEQQDPYFLQKPNAAGKMGMSTIQIITAAFWQLAYGSPADGVDEYICIYKSIAIESLHRFCYSVVCIFGDQYL